MIKIKSEIIGGKQVYIYLRNKAKYLIVQPVADNDIKRLEDQIMEINRLSNKDYLFIAFKVEDWKADLTAWPSKAKFTDEIFGSNAKSTLSYILDSLLPKIKADYDIDKNKLILGGYSLAGLFALWSGYKSSDFDSISAASPSLWYDGWIEFIESNKIQAPSIYLSLGDLEGKSKKLSILDKNKDIQLKLLIDQIGDSKVYFEWNQGNHFKDTGLRMAKAFAWSLNNN